MPSNLPPAFVGINANMAIADSRPPAEAVPRPFTVADLSEMPRELPSGPAHYEFDNGRLIAMSPPGQRHAEIEYRIAKSLGDAVEPQSLGKIYVGEAGIVLWRNPAAWSARISHSFAGNLCP